MPAIPYTKLVGSSSLVGLLAASSADAIIVTNSDLGLAGFTVSDATNSQIDWNIDGDDGGIAELQVVTSAYSDFISLTSFQNDFSVGVLGNLLLNVSAGNPVGEIGGFSGGELRTVLALGSFARAYGFTSGESGYIGFRFTPNDTILHGWAEIVLTEDSGGTGSFQVVQWAFEDSGADILVGATSSAVPEPATTAAGLGLLALGAAGVRRWRQSKC